MAKEKIDKSIPKNFGIKELTRWFKNNNQSKGHKFKIKKVDGKETIVLTGNPYKLNLPDDWRYDKKYGFKNTYKEGEKPIPIQPKPLKKVNDGLDIMYCIEQHYKNSGLEVKYDSSTGSIVLDGKSLKDIDLNECLPNGSSYRFAKDNNGQTVLTNKGNVVDKALSISIKAGENVNAIGTEDASDDKATLDGIAAKTGGANTNGDETNNKNFAINVEKYFGANTFDIQKALDTAKSLGYSIKDIKEKFAIQFDSTGTPVVLDKDGNRIDDKAMCDAVIATNYMVDKVAGRGGVIDPTNIEELKKFADELSGMNSEKTEDLINKHQDNKTINPEEANNADDILNDGVDGSTAVDSTITNINVGGNQISDVTPIEAGNSNESNEIPADLLSEDAPSPTTDTISDKDKEFVGGLKERNSKFKFVRRGNNLCIQSLEDNTVYYDPATVNKAILLDYIIKTHGNDGDSIILAKYNAFMADPMKCREVIEAHGRELLNSAEITKDPIEDENENEVVMEMVKRNNGGSN